MHVFRFYSYELLFSLGSTFTCATAGNSSLPDLTEDIRRRESPLMYINGLSRRVGSFLMISVDIRGLATLFSYFSRVSRGNRQQHCFSLALPFPSRTPFFSPSPPALSPSIWRLAFGIPFLILGHTEDLLPRTRRGPLVMTATLQCTRRPELHNRMLQRTRRMHLAAYPSIVRWISLTFHSRYCKRNDWKYICCAFVKNCKKQINIYKTVCVKLWLVYVIIASHISCM